jgi:hypothetical protein
MKWLILDMDNCISDDHWRQHEIQWGLKDLNKRYWNYNTLCSFDKYVKPDIDFSKYCIAIFTTRPNFCRAMTHEWCNRNKIGYAVLLMRDYKDHRPSAEVKKDMLLDLRKIRGLSFKDIALAVDDRKDVLAVYQRFGIPTLQIKLNENHKDIT